MNDFDWKCINTLKSLSIDQVQEANSGHPGAPLGLAPVVHILATRFIRWGGCGLDARREAASPTKIVSYPAAISFICRDRFILSNGHACALQYALLHLLGILSMDDLRAFRKVDSRYLVN